MTGRMSFSNTTSFHDSSTGTPAYDFVARPKNAVPSSNGTFASVPVSTEPPTTLAPGYVPEKARGFTRPVKAVIGTTLAAGFAVLGVVGGNAAWSSYQDHQRSQVIKATHIVLPSSIVGMAKRGGTVQTQVDRLASQINTPTPAQGAAYVATRSRVALVLAGTYAMSDKDQRDYLTGVSDTARSMGITLSQVDAGSLGGQMMCGSPAKSAQTLCAFTDVAAYGVLVVPGAGSNGIDTAGAFRAAVERRN